MHKTEDTTEMNGANIERKFAMPGEIVGEKLKKLVETAETTSEMVKAVGRQTVNFVTKDGKQIANFVTNDATRGAITAKTQIAITIETVAVITEIIAITARRRAFIIITDAATFAVTNQSKRLKQEKAALL